MEDFVFFMNYVVSNEVQYIGVDDLTIDLFESQYPVPEGVSYNSYVILDEKVAVMDTVDKRGAKQWEENLVATLDGRQVDYLVIHHLLKSVRNLCMSVQEYFQYNALDIFPHYKLEQ